MQGILSPAGRFAAEDHVEKQRLSFYIHSSASFWGSVGQTQGHKKEFMMSRGRPSEIAVYFLMVT